MQWMVMDLWTSIWASFWWSWNSPHQIMSVEMGKKKCFPSCPGALFEPVKREPALREVTENDGMCHAVLPWGPQGWALGRAVLLSTDLPWLHHNVQGCIHGRRHGNTESNVGSTHKPFQCCHSSTNSSAWQHVLSAKKHLVQLSFSWVLPCLSLHPVKPHSGGDTAEKCSF